MRTEHLKMAFAAIIVCCLWYMGCNMDDQPDAQPPQAVIADTTSAGLRATATAGLKALASMTPLEAAGVLTATGHGSTVWKWTPPVDGAPVDAYRVEFHFTVRDTFFRYWFPSWAECVGDTVIVEGVDAAGRVGPGSLPGVCDSAGVE